MFVGSILDDVRYSSQLSQGYKYCDVCRGRGHYYTYKNIKWYGLRNSIPHPDIINFDCEECKGIGQVRLSYLGRS